MPYGNLRFCPDCLIEDGQGARNINSARRVRLIWSFSFVHTCPVHHLPLIARNDPAYTLIKPLMELVPQDREALARLRDGLTRSPPSGLQDYLVARLRSRTVGSLWLDQQSIDQVATATVLLGGLLRYGADSLIKDYDDDLAARDGWEWMSRGPEAVRGALEDFARCIPGGVGGRARLGAVDRIVVSCRASDKGSPLAGLLLDVTSPGSRAKVRMPFASQDFRGSHPIGAIAELARIDVKKLIPSLEAARLVPSGMLREGMTQKERHKALFVSRINGDAGFEAAWLVADGVERTTLPELLHGPEHQTEALIGTLLPLQVMRKIPADLVPRRISRKSVEEFRKLLGAIPTRPLAPSGFFALDEAAEISGETLTTILGSVFAQPNGDAGAFRLENRRGLAGIVVDTAFIAERVSPERVRSFTFSEVADMLEARVEAVERLVSSRDGAVLLAKPRDIDVIRPADFQAFSSRYVVPGVLAKKIGLSREEVVDRLAELGIFPDEQCAELGATLYRMVHVEAYLFPMERPEFRDVQVF